jgi:hypothetical protein
VWLCFFLQAAPDTNSIVISGTVKQLKQQPITRGYRSRSIALVQIDRKS